MRRFSILLFSLTILFQFVFAGRYYDSRTGRFLQIDQKAQKYPAWSPYNYTLDNPIRNIDPDGQEVKVYTERLGSATLSKNVNGPIDAVKRTAAWLYGPRHSFMRVTTDKVDKIIELGGPIDGKTKGNPLDNDVKGTVSERSGQEEHNVNRPQGVGEKDYAGFENKILDVFNTVKDNLPDYNAVDGPNSNGFIKFLIEAAGGGVDLPSSAVGKDQIKQYWEQYKKSLEDQKKKDQEQKQGGQQ